MHHPTDRITHTTAFVTPVVEHWLEREIAQWVEDKVSSLMNVSHYIPFIYSIYTKERWEGVNDVSFHPGCCFF